uniref:Uncharacterized protein n=1 Tax=Rhizophora mucronata TaxID=61149 RepID=A0A2P2N9L5_RHIMU
MCYDGAKKKDLYIIGRRIPGFLALMNGYKPSIYAKWPIFHKRCLYSYIRAHLWSKNSLLVK